MRGPYDLKRKVKINPLPARVCVTTLSSWPPGRSHGTDRISIIHHYNTLFFVPIHSGGELARTSDLGLMFSDLTLGRRGSPPQATPPPGWHDTGRTSSRCHPEPVGPSESVARAREPWADTLGTRSPCQRTSSEHLDRNLLAVRQTWSTPRYVVSSASELRVYEGGVVAGVSYLHYYIYGSGPCTQHVHGSNNYTRDCTCFL